MKSRRITDPKILIAARQLPALVVPAALLLMTQMFPAAII
jgi:hypothetical protein